MFSTLSDRWQDGPEGPTLEIPEGWGQGRATFGGFVVAAGAALARRATERPLRVVQSQFLAPVAPGQVGARMQVLREGRTTTVVQIHLEQGGRLAALLTLTHAVDRPDAREVPGPEAPDWQPPETYPALPYLEGITPEFTRNYAFRWAEGHLPFQGGTEARTGGYIALREPEPPSVEGLLAALDSFPTPTLSLLDRPAPSSSATWTAHLAGPPRPGPYAFRYETVSATAGLSISVGHAWAADGTYLAFTEQAIAVFDG